MVYTAAFKEHFSEKSFKANPSWDDFGGILFFYYFVARLLVLMHQSTVIVYTLLYAAFVGRVWFLHKLECCEIISETIPRLANEGFRCIWSTV